MLLSSPAVAGFLVRPPSPAEQPVIRRLLPGAAREESIRGFRVAIDEAERRLAGAASWRMYPDWTADLQVRVIQPYRRRGIGGLLVRTILAEEELRGSRRADAWSDLTAHPDSGPFFPALGFTEEDRLFTFEGLFEPSRPTLQALADRFRATGRVPDSTRVVGLAEAPPEQVAELYGRFISRNPGFRLGLFAARLDPSAYPHSPVLMADGQVAGFILASVEGEVVDVPARIVAPGRRQGWANVLLLWQALLLAHNAGARRVRLQYWQGNTDTERLCARFDGSIVSVHALFGRSLDGER